MDNKKTENCMICGEELAYLTTAIESAIQYFQEVLGTELEHILVSKLRCEHSSRNKQCSGADCRFYAGKQEF